MPAENPDFIQALEEFNKAQALLDIAIQAELKAVTIATNHWLDLAKTRESWLKKILEEKGLDLCDRYHSHWPRHWHYFSPRLQGKDTSIISPEDVGLFPKSDLRMKYSETTKTKDLLLKEVLPFRSFTFVEKLCQQHFPKEPINKTYSFDYEGRPNFQSEVIEKGGRLITYIHETDVTNRYVKDYPDVVYDYFGIPDLPPRPKIAHKN